jgi:Leucine-rich repeat (LRR) protein
MKKGKGIFKKKIIISGVIRGGALQAQKTLERLDVSGNRLTTIEGGAFRGLKNVKQLSLGHNRLSRFNSDIFAGKNKNVFIPYKTYFKKCNFI